MEKKHQEGKKHDNVPYLKNGVMEMQSFVPTKHPIHTVETW